MSTTLRVFPAQQPPTPNQLAAACRGIDGSELVETFLFLRHHAGMTAADALRSNDFRFAFMQLVQQVHAKARGGAA